VIEPRETLRNLFRPSILQDGRYGCLRLDKNENTEGFSKEAIAEMLSGITPDFIAAYPEPYDLYRKIANRHQIEPDSLVLTAGSEIAIRYVLEAFLSPGDEIVILNPSFAMFEVYSAMIGAIVTRVNYDDRFQLSPQSCLEKISSRTKVVAVANPNNPTGTKFSEPELESILRGAAQTETLVLLDEAYYYFCKDTMIGRHVEFPNLVVTRTFSKACGVAGVRLGYAVGQPNVISQVKKLQPIDHVSNFALKVGEYILDHEDLVWKYVAAVEDGKKLLISEFLKLGIRCIGSHANFVLADLGNRQEEINAKLRQRNILVGANLRLPFPSGYIRITAGPVLQMNQFMDTLKDILSGLDIPSYLYGTALQSRG